MASAVIIGVGQTSYEARKDGVSLQELIFEAASLALADAGMRRSEIDSVVIGSQDLVDGRGISNMQNAGPAGSYLKDEIRVANDGIYALILASMQIAAGRSRHALVISWAKCSESDADAISAAEFDPFYDRPVGLTESIALAMQATALLRENPKARRAASDLVVNSHRAGSRNPLTSQSRTVTAADVESSSLVSWPLRALDLCPRTDGACAILLAAADQAPRSRHPPVSVAGTGWESDDYGLGARSLLQSNSLRRASGRALQQAGLTLADVDVAEFTAHSSFEHLIVLRDLGINPWRGSDGAHGDEAPDPLGRIAVNPSGGALTANPTAAVGLIRVAEAALQLMERAGLRQVENARVGLSHGSSGQCLQSNGVVVLRRLGS